jgi:hypothetical protein
MKKSPTKPKSTKRPAKKKTWRQRLSTAWALLSFFVFVFGTSYFGASVANWVRDNDRFSPNLLLGAYAYQCGKLGGRLLVDNITETIDCAPPASTSTAPGPYIYLQPSADLI